MRRAKPQLAFVRPTFLRLVPRQTLPFAIIDVGEAVDRARLETKRRRDCCARLTTAAERARVDRVRFPGRCNVTRRRLRLSATEARQGEFGAPAKPFGRQPVDVSVSHENDPDHRYAFGATTRCSAQRAIASPISRPESSWMKWLPGTVTSV